MKKRYAVSGEVPFMLDLVEGPWVDPVGGGFVTADLDPEREEFLVKAGFLKEVTEDAPQPPTKKKKAAEE